MTACPPTLYIFPHAGGSAQYYAPFAKAFSGVKCIAVQYPGRKGAHDIGSASSIPELADRLEKMLAPQADSASQVAFFGHSMGALLSFELARRFDANGTPIAALFVSACAAPGRIGYEYIPESDRGLLDAVSEFTGVNPEFLENEEFAAKILPTLRGLKAISQYECPPDAGVSCPIYAFYGDDDEVATSDKVAGWAQRTTSAFGAREFSNPGHHFYLLDHVTEVAADVQDRISAHVRS